ncbi:FAD-dependent monooxygenase [Hyphomicrobium sp.]|uniref:FAD-dependent monooxygenase n=1 Tax=Hyphomicrobium sp. TaxID=82 RepID=UPI0025BEEFB0|nr:FAD-dependent monooxygenase [Hyphomicrobium sp.]MCC7251013.1 FAD-dependent monooxygenase [Hyphomicrobium sp.]
MIATPPSRSAHLEKVLIAGGGIGGLATALALARRGIASTVLERRLLFGEDGAGIQIGPNGTRILEMLGAASALKPRVTAPDALRILDAATARPLGTFPLGRWIAERHGAPYWVAHRRDLHNALLVAAEREPLIRLRMGFDVTVVEEMGDTVTAVSSAADEARGDALIAADGAWSILRRDAFAAGTPVYTGKCAVRVVLPIEEVPEALNRTEVHLWLGPDVHVVHYPVSAGHGVALVAVFDDRQVAADWSAPCDRAWVMARTTGFAPLLQDLLAKPEHWRRWSLMRLARRPRVAVGRTALLGDAAHPVLPFLAQGGVMALEDAVVVADALATDPGDPAHALAAYARRREARVRRVAQASRMNGVIFHLSGRMAAARNMVLARTPPERFMRRYDWLYGWTPPQSE